MDKKKPNNAQTRTTNNNNKNSLSQKLQSVSIQSKAQSQSSQATKAQTSKAAQAQTSKAAQARQPNTNNDSKNKQTKPFLAEFMVEYMPERNKNGSLKITRENKRLLGTIRSLSKTLKNAVPKENTDIVIDRKKRDILDELLEEWKAYLYMLNTKYNTENFNTDDVYSEYCRDENKRDYRTVDGICPPLAVPFLKKLLADGLYPTEALEAYLEQIPIMSRYFNDFVENDLYTDNQENSIESILNVLIDNGADTDGLVDLILNLDDVDELYGELFEDHNVRSFLLCFFMMKGIITERELDLYLVEYTGKNWNEIDPVELEEIDMNTTDEQEIRLRYMQYIKRYYDMWNGDWFGGSTSKTYKTYKTYNKKRYVVRTGSKGGRYILVNNKKKYIS